VAYVPTESMEDEILKGDMILIHTNVDEFSEGDVISFWATIDNQKVSVTHRIVAIDSEGIITTKGDNNEISASWETKIEPDQIIGVYKGQRSHFLGSVYGTLFSGNVNVIFLMIILIFIAVIILEFLNLVKLLQKKKREEEMARLIEEEKQKLLENEDRA